MTATARRALLYVQLALWAPFAVGVGLSFPLMFLLTLGDAACLAVLATGLGVISTWVIALAFLRGQPLGWPLYTKAPWVSAAVGPGVALLTAISLQGTPEDAKGFAVFFWAAVPGWCPLAQLGYEAWRDSRPRAVGAGR